MECAGACQGLWSMWMTHPYQAGGLQGSRGGSCDTLAANDPGTGTGWQQSKQNWMPPAVEGP